MNRSTLSKISEVIASVFIMVFAYTAMSKLFTHKIFLITLKKFPVLGLAGAFLSWAVPIAELLVVGLLFVPSFRKYGFVGSFGLMALFTAYIIYMLMFSSHLPCSCGGIVAKLTWKAHLWLNIFLTILAATGLFLSNRVKILLQ